jgi:hypothetical protein
MSQRRVLLVVEGQHDEAFIAAVLRARHGLIAKTRLSQVDPYWEMTIPRTFPHDDDLRRRVPVPYFYAKDDVSLAVVVAIGDSRLVDVVGDTLAILPAPAIDAIGIVLDADERKTVGERYASIQKDLLSLHLVPGAAPGVVTASTPNCGVYILPDNVSNGTLEHILIECAEKNYLTALNAARALVQRIDPADYQGGDLREFNKPAGKNKAIVAMITAILKPGKTTQASISDNRWLSGEALMLDSVKNFGKFLEKLLTGQSGQPDLLSPTTSAEATDAERASLAADAADGEDRGS